MNNSLLQLLVLAGIAVFLILKLRSVLGTRDGFEKPPVPVDEARPAPVRRSFDVIEGGPDRDITDHVADGSAAAKALAAKGSPNDGDPEALVVIATNLALALNRESALGMTAGHSAVDTLVSRFLDRIEPL